MTILTRKQIEAIANHHRYDVDLGRWDGDELDLMDTARAYHDLRDAVLAIHHKYPIYDECSHDDQEACGAWESSDCGIFLCGPVLYVQCAECRCQDCDGKIADFPCATVEVVARVERGE